MLEFIKTFSEKYTEENSGNFIAEDIAITPELVGLKIYEAPVMAIASAEDPMWRELKENAEAYGPDLMLPTEWLPEARTVISIFFPFTDRVKKSNATESKETSGEWLHARVEGQDFIDSFTRDLGAVLQEKGGKVAMPCIDQRFTINPGTIRSNWSERHAAFVSGLGTFGLSGGLITKRGMAGRFTSIITDLALPATERPYTDVYEYCSHCLECAKRCPVNAISAEGKDHPPCQKYVGHTGEIYAPRYGCGKCQCGVPCESERPKYKER